MLKRKRHYTCKSCGAETNGLNPVCYDCAVSKKKKNKYGAKRTQIDGVHFASGLEGAVYSILDFKQKAGEISELEMQPSVKLSGAQIGYKPDFKYFHNVESEYRWVEAKGVETEGYRIRVNLWKVYGPGKLEVYKGSASRPQLVKTIVPKNQQGTSKDLCPHCGEEISA